jgi:hypothetical protein
MDRRRLASPTARDKRSPPHYAHVPIMTALSLADDHVRAHVSATEIDRRGVPVIKLLASVEFSFELPSLERVSTWTAVAFSFAQS